MPPFRILPPAAFAAAVALAAAPVPGLAAQTHVQQAEAAGVPLYDNLGDHHYEVSVRVPAAQRYFDQGLRLVWAFNHGEAIRAFNEGERLDSTCAMCAWGEAFAYGPNINGGMDSASGAAAHAAIRRASARASGVSEREQALIAALAQRYAAVPAPQRAGLDSAWAAAIGEVADRYPADQEAQVLHADALMNLSPWNYWSREGAPRPATPVMLRRLESVLAANPNHPGACHLFIHAVEAAHPGRAVACAERLAALMPGAGHLVHMPGHIYIRVGRYLDAIAANEHAVHADESYLEGPAVSRQGVYAQGYYPHNYHFMNFAASFAGMSNTAIRAARSVTATVGAEVARAHPWLESVTPVVWQTYVTFGRWDAILAEPLPPKDLRYTTGIAYYARGVAFTAKRRWAEARAALDTVSAVAAAFPEGDNRTALRIAAEMLRGEIAMRSGRHQNALRAFRAAQELEDGLAYTEPPYWYYPVRQSLGKALLAAGQPAEAERAYREDLERFPENGWSLFGLAQSLDAQGRKADATKVRTRFARAWRHADVRLAASRF
jgi:tetratricopeptide (TPR) repeat protein